MNQAQAITLKIGLEGSSQVTASLSGVEGRLDALNNSVKKTAHYGAALGVALGTDLAGKVASFGHSAILAADAMTNMVSRLALVSGGTQNAIAVQGKLFEIAQSSRVSFVELASTYTTLARAGGQLGISQERMLAVTESVGQAMLLSGSSSQSLQAALVQLGQGLSSGTLRGEELNSILEQAPRLAQAMAEGLGVNVGQLRSLGEQGKLTATAVVEALEKAGPKLAAELSQSTLTVGQSMQVLSNSATRFAGDIDKATGASKTLAEGLRLVASGFTALGTAARDNEGAVKVLGGAAAGAVAVAALAAALGGVKMAISAIGAVLSANPAVRALIIGGAAVGSAVSYFKNREDEYNSLTGKIQQLSDAERELNANRMMGVRDSNGMNQALIERIALLKEQIATEQLAVRDQLRRSELGDRNANAGPFPDATTIDEARKSAQMDMEIRRKYVDARVQLEKAFAQAQFKESDPGKREEMARELVSRRAELSRLEGDELQSAAAKRTADARALDSANLDFEQQQADNAATLRKLGLERLNSINEQMHGAGLRELNQYLEEKYRLEQQDLYLEKQAIEQRIKIEQAKTVVPGDAAALQAKRNRIEALRGALAENAAKQNIAQARPGYDFEQADAAQQKAVLDENIRRNNERITAAQSAYQDIAQSNREAAVAMIKDDKQRGEAQIELERTIMEKRIEPLKNTMPDAYADAMQAVNDAVAMKHERLTESLKPEWQRLLEGWQDTTKLMKDAFGGAMSGALKSGEDAFVSFVQTGKLNFKSLADSIIADIARAQFKAMAARLFSLISGGGMTVDTAGYGIGRTRTDGGVGLPTRGAAARGAYFDSSAGMAAFASGGIFNSPHMFRFAQGGSFHSGLMGEAGPEAIMPLQRGPNGRLGVTLNGGGVGATTTVNVQGDATPQTVRLIESALASYDRKRRMLEGR